MDRLGRGTFLLLGRVSREEVSLVSVLLGDRLHLNTVQTLEIPTTAGAMEEVVEQETLGTTAICAE
jgi:hypothetical protein